MLQRLLPIHATGFQVSATKHTALLHTDKDKLMPWSSFAISTSLTTQKAYLQGTHYQEEGAGPQDPAYPPLGTQTQRAGAGLREGPAAGAHHTAGIRPHFDQGSSTGQDNRTPSVGIRTTAGRRS